MNHQAPSPERGATPEQLAVLAPLGAMSAGRLREIADIAVVEHAARGSDPLAAHSSNRHSVFLLRGEMLLVFEGGGTLVVVGGMGDGRHPLNRRALRKCSRASSGSARGAATSSSGKARRARNGCSAARRGWMSAIRRSTAAAFLFAQRGFKVSLLEGGLWAAGRGRQGA